MKIISCLRLCTDRARNQIISILKPHGAVLFKVLMKNNLKREDTRAF